MQTISIRQANQNFSHYLSLVERGAEFTVTKRGKQVARLLPAVVVDGLNALDARSRYLEISQQLDAELAKLPKVNFGGPYDRDEAYD